MTYTCSPIGFFAMTYYMKDQNLCLAKVPIVPNNDPNFHPVSKHVYDTKEDNEQPSNLQTYSVD